MVRGVLSYAWPNVNRSLVGSPVDPDDHHSYAAWIDTLEERAAEPPGQIVLSQQESGRAALFAVIVTYASADELAGKLASVAAQTYPPAELWVVAESSHLTDCEVSAPRRAVSRNDALLQCVSPWIVVLDGSHQLAPHALAALAAAVQDHPDAELIYADEDSIEDNGQRLDPWFKPEFSRELLRSQNYFGSFAAYRAERLRILGGWREDYGHSVGFDLNLRMAESLDRERIVHVPQILSHARSSMSPGYEATESSLRALNDHAERVHLKARAECTPQGAGFRLRLALPEPAPKVTIIIPTRNREDLLRPCVESILERTSYPNFDVLIADNGSRDRGTLRLFGELEATGRVERICVPGPFNYSAFNNAAVTRASGDILAFVNNDAEVISSGWLSEMTSWAVQPDIGCVGATLYYPNDTVQHAGVVLGLCGGVGHSHKHFPRGHPGYRGRLTVVSNVSAVTGACMVVRKSVFQAVGGFDEEHLAVAFNDIDFCLRVRELGLENVFTPFAELYHREGASRGRDRSPRGWTRLQAEITYFMRRWDVSSDPYYSPHLTRDREDFSIRSLADRY